MTRRLEIRPAVELARRWRTTDDRLSTTTRLVAVLLDEPLADLLIVSDVNGRRAHVIHAHEFLGRHGSDGGSTVAWCGASLGDRADVYALGPRQGIPACQTCVRGLTADRPGTNRDVIVAALAVVGPVDGSEAP